MRWRSSLTACCILLVLCAPARAAVHVQAGLLTLPGVTAQHVDLRLEENTAGPPQLSLQIGSLDVAVLGWRGVGLSFEGSLARLQATRWQVKGELALSSTPGGALRQARMTAILDRDANTAQVVLDAGTTDLDIAMPLDQPSHLQIDASQLPLAWAQGVLERIWKAGKLGKGSVDARLSLDAGDDAVRSAGNFTLHSAAFDSSSGTLAAQALDGRGKWRLQTAGRRSSIEVDATLQGGQLLLGPLYAALPDHASQVHLQADFAPGSVRLSSVRFNDGDALGLRGSMAFTSDGEVTAVDIEAIEARLPQALQRYARSWLQTLGFGDVSSDGLLSGSLDYSGGALRSFRLNASDLDLADAGGRIAVRGMNGGFDWRASGSRDPTTLAWRGLRLWSLPLGPAHTRWQSRDGMVRLAAPVGIPLLGGQLRLQQLDWSPVSRQHLGVSLAVTGVSMPALSKTLGWPQFQGTLAGAIPALHYHGEQVDLEGGLSLHVFGGFIDVTDLSLQRPFEAAPLLQADIALRDLDLQAVTSTFKVGSMTGRLDGAIKGLRLLAWKPVAFDASLHADGGRISQRAIDSLSQLGGGLAGGLQSAVLKIFDSFGYSAFGLSCRLQNEVCQMGGIEPVDGGYTIVEGRGLPHIEVIGHQRAVDWPTLVARLKAASKGGGPTVH
ncbi:MAG TPA: hypothetical protein VFG73_11630 [Rhodanobacteraceae bacterium]|nr:hypothetical protein [Rhodanobacteraceae bacterium]